MALPKEEKVTGKAKSDGDQWRDAMRKTLTTKAAYLAAKEESDRRGDGIAKTLIDNHNGAPIDLDGIKYKPKKGTSRKVKGDDGAETVKAPKYAHILVCSAGLDTVDV
jgi:hypothetical protein